MKTAEEIYDEGMAVQRAVAVNDLVASKRVPAKRAEQIYAEQELAGRAGKIAQIAAAMDQHEAGVKAVQAAADAQKVEDARCAELRVECAERLGCEPSHVRISNVFEEAGRRFRICTMVTPHVAGEDGHGFTPRPPMRLEIAP